MTSRSPKKRKSSDRADYGFARARDLAFDAVYSLWRQRQEDGMKQVDIARTLDRSPTWVNRSLRGPGNWTLRTFGELVEALGGEIELSVHALEEALPARPNYHAYAGYECGTDIVVGSAYPLSTVPSSSALNGGTPDISPVPAILHSLTSGA